MTSQRANQTKTSEHDRTSQASATAKSAAPAMHPMLHLQQQVGNQAVGRLIQAKLTVGEPNDVYEQEADRAAAEVVSKIHAPQNVSTNQTTSVQRQVVGNDEKELRMKPLIQCKSDMGGMAVSPEIESSIQQERGSGQPLAESIRTPMEQAFGTDFSGVRVHTGAESDRLNRSIQAKAFTTGQDVFFRQGEYSPSSRNGQELLAHELTHVVQQTATEVQPQSSVIAKSQHISTKAREVVQRGTDKSEGSKAEITEETLFEDKPKDSNQVFTTEHEGHQIKTLNPKEENEFKEQVINTLHEWVEYANKYHTSELDKSVTDSYFEKIKRGKSYYDEANFEDRKKRKFLVKKYTELDGCINESNVIKEQLNKTSSDIFLIARNDNQIQGVLQISENGFIRNIVVSPYNFTFVEPPTGYHPVQGTLKALLKGAFQWNQQYSKEQKEVKLCALSNMIKKIYDNYGFQVYFRKPETEEQKGTFKRPIVPRHKGGIADTWKIKPNEKESLWYHEKLMKINLKDQNNFLEGKYKKYFDRTDESIKK
jgi:Domain of unknown function (DUF4157)